MRYQARFAILFAAAACTFAATTDVTYHKDVEPILQKHCQECHRPGEIAPFSLLSYSDARPWAKAIRADLLTKKMPPWFADPQVGHFSNDRSLTAEEVSKVVSWVDGGAKEGSSKDAPKALAFVDGWNIQKPDVVLSMKESFHLPAKGDIPYQYVVLPTQFTEDKWVQMAEARPSDRTVVHHVVIFVRDPESKWLREAKTNVPFVPSGGDFQNISGGGNDILMVYTPGKVPEMWRPGLGKMIKAGSDLVLQIHYTTNGKETEDHTQVGLVFAKEKPTERALTIGGYNLGFKIPPQDPDYKVVAKNSFPNGATILNFFPHMHLRGKSFEYTVVYPDGHSELLLRVPKYDFFWQLSYELSKPLTIPPGSQIICTASYDNSPNNPKNPDPTATVRFGEQSWEEMMIGFYDVQMPADMSVKDFFTPKKTEAATTGSSGQ